MREIKFRAWDKKSKQMSEVFTIDDLVRYEHIFETMFPQFPTFSELIWLEYTGLKDKNGKEIYESDYLKTDEADWTGKVVFQRGAFILLDDMGGFSAEPNWEQCEVVGNEYQG